MPTKEEVLDALANVIDPELGINIVDLGLVYDVDINGEKVCVKNTLTSPQCPMGGIIEQDIRNHVSEMSGVKEVDINLVFDPPWGQDKMSDEAKLTLGYDI